MSRQLSTVLLCSCSLFVGASVAAHPGHESHDQPTDSAVVSSTTPVISYLEARLQDNPSDLAARSRLSSALLQLARATGLHEDYERVESSCRAQIELDPRNLGARVGLAYALLGQHEFREGLRWARDAAHSRPNDPTMWALLADLHLALGHDIEAEALIERLVADSLTVETLSRQALLASYRGQHSRALALMNDAYEAGRLLNVSPTTLAWCRTISGEMLYDTHQFESATAMLDAALVLSPGYPVARSLKAKIAIAEGRLAAARTTLADLVEDNPRPAFIVLLGDVMIAQGDEQAGQAWLDRAEKMMLDEVEHGDMGHVRELVEFWTSHDREPERAVALARHDLEEVRRDAAAFATLGWALYKAGDIDAALPQMYEALRRSPRQHTWLEQAEVILRAAGRDDEAEHLRRTQTQLRTLAHGG